MAGISHDWRPGLPSRRGGSRRDSYQNTRRYCLNIKWLKNVAHTKSKVYTAVCDCGTSHTLPQFRLYRSAKNVMRDCGCGIYELRSGPDDAA